MATYSLKKDGDKQLSARFKVREFACTGSDTIVIADGLVPMLQKVADTAGATKVIVSDGYRTAAYNKAIGGATNSRHLYGEAADLTFYLPSGSQIPARTMCQIAERLGVLGIEQISSTYLHLDIRKVKWFSIQLAMQNGVRRYQDVSTFFDTPTIQPGQPNPNYPTLRVGSTGVPVETLQKLLNALVKAGAATMKVDGIFGAATEKYVKSFQTSRSLKSDGIVGPATWDALNKK